MIKDETEEGRWELVCEDEEYMQAAILFFDKSFPLLEKGKGLYALRKK